jgi:hypothetical protein
VSTNRPARQRTRSLSKGSTLYTPNASAARHTAERHSARPLLYLYQLPRWVPAVLLAVLLVVGLAVRGVAGTVALVAVTVVLGWLAALSWPRLTAGGRAGRVLVIAVLLAVAGYQIAR